MPHEVVRNVAPVNPETQTHQFYSNTSTSTADMGGKKMQTKTQNEQNYINTRDNKDTINIVLDNCLLNSVWNTRNSHIVCG